MTQAPDDRAAPEYYADAFTIAWSPFGLDVTFGRSLDPETGLRVPRATIVMSQQLAEALATELTRIIEANAEQTTRPPALS